MRIRKARIEVRGHPEYKVCGKLPTTQVSLDNRRKADPHWAMILHVEAFDWNCPQHLTPRYTIEEVRELNTPLYEHIAKLEPEVERLKQS